METICMTSQELSMIINKNPNLGFKSYENNIITINSGTSEFTIEYPSKVFLVKSDTKVSFLKLINMISKRKKFTLEQLINKLSENIEKNSRQTFSSVNDTDFESALELLSQFDINLEKEISEIEKYFKTSISPLSLNEDSNDSKLGQLFSKEAVQKLLLTEYKKTKQKYKDSSKVKLSTINNNIYRWKLEFFNFSNHELKESLKTLNEKFGYESLYLELNFHDKLYPNYPISVKYIRPRLNKFLMHRLSNLRMINSDYWRPTRDAYFVIEKLYKVLNDHASVDTVTELNNSENNPEGAYLSLEGELIKLSSFCGDIDSAEDLDSEIYEKLIVTKESTSTLSSNSKSTWASGTGYGTDGSQNWNPKEYVKIQKEKENQQCNILTSILTSLEDNNDNDSIYNMIKDSYLIKYIISQLKENSMIEIEKKSKLFKLIFSIMQFLSTEKGVSLYNDGKPDCLYNVLQVLVKNAQREKKLVNDGTLSTVDTILTINEMIEPLYKNYIEKELIITNNTKEETGEKSLKEIYAEKLGEYKLVYGEVNNSNFCKFGTYYGKSNTSALTKKAQKAITHEIGFMESSLPIHYDSSAFYVLDENSLQTARVMITGPDNTPYDSGVFIFDVKFPSDYPNKAPFVEIVNNGGKRFNPNLYDSGKVCLSLLGTWHGHGGESWVPGQSTMYQVILSIQSLILIPDPYFNEPGDERLRGSEIGDKKNREYNNRIRLYTMTHTINDMLEKPNQYDGLTEPILEHFKLKKEYILHVCEKWTHEAPESSKSKYTKQLERMKVLFSKL